MHPLSTKLQAAYELFILGLIALTLPCGWIAYSEQTWNVWRLLSLFALTVVILGAINELRTTSALHAIHSARCDLANCNRTTGSDTVG